MPKFAFKLVWVVALALLLSATAALAQTNTTTNSANVAASGATSTIIDDQLQGVAVTAPQAMPTKWGLWWKDAKEKLSIWTTVNPVKKAEKQLRFAEERLKYAEYIAEHATDVKRQEWAQKMVTKANEYMERIEANKEKWQNDPQAAKRQLIRNLATHQVRKEKILDKMEEKLPAEKLEALQKLRVKSIENSQRLINAINNTNISTSTRQHLQAVKDRIEDHLQDVRNYQKQKQDLLEKIKGGDTTATSALKQLNEARKAEIKANVEKYKQILPERPIKPDRPTSTSSATVEPVIKQIAPAPSPKIGEGPVVRPAVKAAAQIKKQLNKPVATSTGTLSSATSTE